MLNIEGMNPVYFIKKIEQRETILRHSAVLLFAVQPLNPEPLQFYIAIYRRIL